VKVPKKTTSTPNTCKRRRDMATKQNQSVEKQRKIVNARQSKISKIGINPQPSSSAYINEQGPSKNTRIIDKGNLHESFVRPKVG
jgi:hypothetical protein